MEMDSFVFAGIEVVMRDQIIILHQRKQANKIQILPAEVTFLVFKSRLMALDWITYTRPNISCAVAQMAQVTERRFNAECIKSINKVIRCVKENPCRGLQQCKLDSNTLYVRAYSDGSFVNNPDSSSQLRYILLLCDASQHCNVQHFRPFKGKRVVRSVLGAEVYAFADAFDCAYTTKVDLERILRRNIPLTMQTDSNSLLDVMVKTSYTTERRVMIDLEAARIAYEAMEISDLGFIRSQFNPADAFTKVGYCEALERVIVDNSVDRWGDHPIEQWVIRKQSSTKEKPRTVE